MITKIRSKLLGLKDHAIRSRNSARSIFNKETAGDAHQYSRKNNENASFNYGFGGFVTIAVALIFFAINPKSYNYKNLDFLSDDPFKISVLIFAYFFFSSRSRFYKSYFFKDFLVCFFNFKNLTKVDDNTSLSDLDYKLYIWYAYYHSELSQCKEKVIQSLNKLNSLKERSSKIDLNELIKELTDKRLRLEKAEKDLHKIYSEVKKSSIEYIETKEIYREGIEILGAFKVNSEAEFLLQTVEEKIAVFKSLHHQTSENLQQSLLSLNSYADATKEMIELKH